MAKKKKKKKNSSVNAGDEREVGLIHGLGRSHKEGNGNLLQYSCLENSMDREALKAIIHGVTKSRTGLSALMRARARARAHTHTHTEWNVEKAVRNIKDVFIPLKASK